MTSPKLDCTLPIDTANVKDKSVFVTGGADGFGAGLVRVLASAGAYVTFGDINGSKGSQLQGELASKGYKVNFVSLDVTSWPTYVSAFKAATAFHPSQTLDIVFLNAGILSPPLLGSVVSNLENETDPADPALQVYDVNLLGVVRGVSLALHHFHLLSSTPAPPSTSPSGNKKAIILTGSLASYIDSSGSEMYGSTKFGVRGLFKSLRSGLPAKGIRINMVAPTYVRTNLFPPSTANRVEGMGIVPSSVDHVVSAMMRLACDDSVNGRSIGIGPSGAFDFQDDWEGHDGFLALKKLVEDGALGVGAAQVMRGLHG